MEETRRFRVLCVMSLALGLVACGGGSSNTEPEVMFDNLSTPVMAMVGATVPIDYTDDDPDDDATTTLYADMDGDLGTTGDQYVIAMDRPEMDGTAQSVTWNTTGVTPGIYRIFAVTDDTHVQTTVEATGRITVNNALGFAPANASALRSTAYNLRITFLFPVTGGTVSAATIPITIGAVQVPGSYAIENGVDVTFTPDACVFPAPAAVLVEVLTTVGTTTQVTGTVAAMSTFTTGVSPVWAIGRVLGGAGGISEVNAITETESDDFTLGADDDPWFGVCSRAGMLYLSTRGGGSDGDIMVFNTLTGTIASRIPLTETDAGLLTIPAGLRLSADESTLYVAVFEADSGGNDFTVAHAYLAVVNVGTGMETNRVPLSADGRLRNLALSPNGLRAYVAGYDSKVIHVIDLPTLAEVDTDGDAMNGITPIATPEIRPSGLETDASGAWLYVSYSGADVGGSTNDVTTFDTATFMEGAPLTTTVNAVSGTPDLTRDPCDGRLYLPHVEYDQADDEGLSVFDPAMGTTATVVITADGSGYNRGVAFVFGTNLVAIGNRDAGEVLILDKTDLASGTSSVGTSNTNVVGLLTIPPMRY